MLSVRTLVFELGVRTLVFDPRGSIWVPNRSHATFSSCVEAMFFVHVFTLRNFEEASSPFLQRLRSLLPFAFEAFEAAWLRASSKCQ